MCKATDGAGALHHPNTEFVCSGSKPVSLGEQIFSGLPPKADLLICTLMSTRPSQDRCCVPEETASAGMVKGTSQMSLAYSPIARSDENHAI
jgi:hypothetical protein